MTWWRSILARLCRRPQPVVEHVYDAELHRELERALDQADRFRRAESAQ